MTSNLVYPRYSLMFDDLKTVRDSLENSYFSTQKSVEDKALQLYSHDVDQAVLYLNNYGNEKAQQMLDRWKRLFTYLVVKYNDMIVKPSNNGVFERTETGIGVPPKRPGYPEKIARELIKQTGEKYVCPKDK